MFAQRFAIVEDGQVTNVTLWNPSEEPDWRPVAGEAVRCPDHVGPGWAFADGKFAPPAQTTED